MSKFSKNQSIDSAIAMQAICSLEKQAKSCSAEAIKKILLSAACSIADLALQQGHAGREAA